MKDSDATENFLDDAIGAIKSDLPSEQSIDAAAQRVQALLIKEEIMELEAEQKPATHQNGNASGSVHDLSAIEHYIAAIPDYLAGRLPSAQKLLLEEESRHSLQLRRELKLAREQLQAERSGVSVQPSLDSIVKQKRPHYLRWFSSAAAMMLVALTAVWMYSFMPSLDQSQLLQVENVKGSLYQVVDGRLQTLNPGDWVSGQMNVRTGPDSTALLRLDDDSRVELNKRTELSVTRRSSGNQINVGRGQIIVAASPQGSGHLDVATNDFVVSVKGTIFQVAQGAMGSTVSVVEGEVNVSQDGSSTSLLPGDELGSTTGLNQNQMLAAFAKEFSWSSNADEYLAMLAEIEQLQRDINAAMASSDRFDTRLLQLMPKDTVVYMAVPNAPQKISDVYQVVRDRIAQSERLSEHWEQLSEASFQVDEVMTWLRELGSHLGEETVVGLVLIDNGMRVQNGVEVRDVQLQPVILSEVDANFRETFAPILREFEAKLAANVDLSNNGQPIQFDIIDNPAQAIDNHPNFWLQGDLLVVSGSVSILDSIQQAIANGSSEFVDGDFYQLLFNQYSEGAQFLGAVDLKTVIATTMSFDGEEAWDEATALGVADAEYLIANRKQEGDSVTTTAELLFSGPRRGLAALLSEPGPMGSLEFFSEDSTIVNAMLFEKPIALLDEFERLMLEHRADAPSLADSAMSNDLNVIDVLRNQVFPSLGGEIAFGLDGPALPTPALKAVVEVGDQTLLQNNIEAAIAELNAGLQAYGHNSFFELISEPADIYSGYRLVLPQPPEEAPAEVAALYIKSINYAYVDGYMVITPNLAMLKRAITQYQSGFNLTLNQRFRALLPNDGSLNVSAVTMSRLQVLVRDLAGSVGYKMTPEQREVFNQYYQSGASIHTIAGGENSIRYFNKGGSFIGANLSSLLTLFNTFGALEVDMDNQKASVSITLPSSTQETATDGQVQ